MKIYVELYEPLSSFTKSKFGENLRDFRDGALCTRL